LGDEERDGKRIMYEYILLLAEWEKWNSMVEDRNLGTERSEEGSRKRKMSLM
jgi:hypothetical protein